MSRTTPAPSGALDRRSPVPWPPSRRRRRSSGRPIWFALVAGISVLVVAPVAAVVLDGLIQVGAAQDGWPRQLPLMVVSTVALMLGVGLGTLLLGGGLAWLVTAHRFPGRTVLAWLLVLPLAMPAYILGFVFLSVFDYPGPVQTGLRAVFGAGVWFPEVRSLPGAVVVLSLTLYPYVYLLARSAWLEQAPATYDAARTLGASRRRAMRRVVLPLARPSLAAGLALVMMETLTDFATVRYFNVQTVSVGVYQVWKGTFDRQSATQLASLVLVFALVVIVAERVLRGGARYHQRGGRGRGLPLESLRGWRAWAATGSCLAVLGAAFVIPVGQLLWWAVAETAADSSTVLDTRFLGYLGNSMVVAGIAASSCVVVALVLGHALRLHGGRFVRGAAQLTMLGYAVPGAVVAIGVLAVFAASDQALEGLGVPGGTGLLATGSVLGIVYAYVVRFLAPAYQSVDASFTKVSPNMTFSALSLGASPRRVLRRVHLPLVRSGVGVGLVLVLIDGLKELPIVLLLRPFGFTTVSVWVYQLASENRWQSAALPALLIVVAAMLPVLLLFSRIRLPEGHR
ncbi:MAG: iron ABC transporter permease [Actinomycetota bacterium]|nr:iron ABC transporter permease [Actinomycetota bacterium]MDQ3424303.1 iron ABC transporter permease [Actinomycetota bacterium]